MLDRRSLRTLAEHPERNDPMLNVALAEEGDATVLFALAECHAVGPEALAKIALRVADEGETVGHEEPDAEDALPRGSRRAAEETVITHGTDLDARLVVHPRSEDVVRDAILARHAGDPFFALAAAAHTRATTLALERVARWPALTPLHDRPWLGLIDPASVPPLLLDAWATDEDPLAREAAARLARDGACLARLATDARRQVRRAVASNPFAATERAHLAERDEAGEVRARAATAVAARADESDVRGSRGVDVTSSRFRAAVAAMKTGGTLAVDVTRAMRAGPLDEEGARLAARALDEASVGALITTRPLTDAIGVALAAGIALRDDVAEEQGALLGSCIHALATADRSGGVLTGKGRLASWLAEGVARAMANASDEVLEALGRTSLAADRMVLGRMAKGSDIVPALATRAAGSSMQVPIALIELAWRDPRVDEETLAMLAAHARPPPKHDASPEHEVDLDPRARPLEVLERVGGVLVHKAPLSPRAALALVALEPRRVRYVLSALPQWKGVLAGVNIARVLRSHAGALSAAGASGTTGGRRAAGVAAGWTQRKLDEAEVAVALAIGDLPARDAALRIASGQDTLLGGTVLAAGIEARAALEGVRCVEPIAELLARARSQDASALATWLLVEGLDRPRSATAIAAALDAPWSVAHGPPRGGTAAPASRSMVAPGIAEALATLERRSPGRLAEVTPQTPRGRAALVSGIARAYRALGGMSVTDA
jgi:hypothetical protein